MSIWQNNFGAPFSFKNVLGVNASIPVSMPGPVPASMPKQETKPPMSVPQNTPANGNASTPVPKQNAPTMKPWSGVLKPEPMKFTSPSDVFKSPANSLLKANQPQQNQSQPQQAQQPTKVEYKKPSHNISTTKAMFWKNVYYDVGDNPVSRSRFEYDPEKWEFNLIGPDIKDVTFKKNVLDRVESIKLQKESELRNAKKRSPQEAELIQKELNAIMKQEDSLKQGIKHIEFWEKRDADDRRVEELNKKMKEMGDDFDPDNNPEHKAMHEEFYHKVGNYNGKDPILYSMRREDMIEGPKDDYNKEINQEAQTANLDNGISDNPAGTENSEASKQEPVKKYNDEEIRNVKSDYITDKIDKAQYEEAIVNYEGTDPETLRLKEMALKKRWQNQTPSETSQPQTQQLDHTHTKDSEWLHNINIIQKGLDFNKADLEWKKKIYDEIKQWMKEQGISEARQQHILKVFENSIKKNEAVQTHQLAQTPEKSRKQIAQEKVATLNQNQELNDGVYEQNKQKLDGFRSQGYNVDQSVVDSLSARGLHNSYDIRKKMYEKMTGQSDFRGTAEQNIYLKNMAERLTEEDIEAILFDEDEIAVMD